jgi:N-acetylglutamate synthase-like GNAT family acetyltransferase
VAYRAVIAANQWKYPYMSEVELRREMRAGIEFFGAFDDDHRLVGVMGLQEVGDVALIRHAYTRTTRQRGGIGSALLAHLRSLTDRPILIGTWRAATWAIQFYEGRGFSRVEDDQVEALLRRYWTIGERQIEESVVLGCERWRHRHGTASQHQR